MLLASNEEFLAVKPRCMARRASHHKSEGGVCPRQYLSPAGLFSVHRQISPLHRKTLLAQMLSNYLIRTIEPQYNLEALTVSAPADEIDHMSYRLKSGKVQARFTCQHIQGRQTPAESLCPLESCMMEEARRQENRMTTVTLTSSPDKQVNRRFGNREVGGHTILFSAHLKGTSFIFVVSSLASAAIL